MAYTKQTWTDGPAGGTPMSAARLGHLEDGVAAAAVVADLGTPGTPTGDAARAAFGAVVTPEAFGAKGDGTTNDTAAVQAALTAGAGKDVAFQAGATYAINAPLLPRSNSVILGRGATLKIGSAPTSDTAAYDTVFKSGGASNVTIDGFVFGTRLSGTNSTDPSAASIVCGDSGWRIQNNRWANNTTTAFVDSGQDNQFVGNDLTGSGVIYGWNGASRALIARNIIRSAPGDAISGVGNGGAGVYSDGNRVLDNVILSAGRMGIEDQSQTRDTIIRGNLIVSAYNQGISVNGTSPLVDGNTIIDATTSGSGDPAIEMAGDVGRCVNNRVSYRSVTPAAGAPGIAVNGPTDATNTTGVIIANNEVRRASIAVKLIATSGPVLIEGNIFDESQMAGVAGAAGGASSGHIIRGNVIRFRATAPAGVIFRDGIVLFGSASAGALIEGNFVLFGSASFTSGVSDNFGRLQVTDCMVSGNRFDADSRVSSPAQFSTGGATVARAFLVGNNFLNGATLSLGNITSYRVLANIGATDASA